MGLIKRLDNWLLNLENGGTPEQSDVQPQPTEPQPTEPTSAADGGELYGFDELED